MGGVGGEARGLLEARVQALHHRIQHRDELGEFTVVLWRRRNAPAEFRRAEFLRGGDHAPQRPHRAPGEPPCPQPRE